MGGEGAGPAEAVHTGWESPSAARCGESYPAGTSGGAHWKQAASVSKKNVHGRYESRDTRPRIVERLPVQGKHPVRPLSPSTLDQRARESSRWALADAQCHGGGARRCTIMVLPSRGDATTRADRLALCRPLSRPSCHGPRPASQAEERGSGVVGGVHRVHARPWMYLGRPSHTWQGRGKPEQRTTPRSTRVWWYLLHLILVRVGVGVVRYVRHRADLPLLHDL